MCCPGGRIVILFKVLSFSALLSLLSLKLILSISSFLMWCKITSGVPVMTDSTGKQSHLTKS